MDENKELRLLLKIADLEGRLARLYQAADRLISRVDMPTHVTAKSYSNSDTKRVPARPLATLRNLVRDMEKNNNEYDRRETAGSDPQVLPEVREPGGVGHGRR